MCDQHKGEILLSGRRLTEDLISTEPCYLTPTDAQNLSGWSSSVTPSEMIGDKVKLYSFPWRRRSTSFNITPKWAFRRFRYLQTSLSHVRMYNQS